MTTSSSHSNARTVRAQKPSLSDSECCRCMRSETSENPGRVRKEQGQKEGSLQRMVHQVSLLSDSPLLTALLSVGKASSVTTASTKISSRMIGLCVGQLCVCVRVDWVTERGSLNACVVQGLYRVSAPRKRGEVHALCHQGTADSTRMRRSEVQHSVFASAISSLTLFVSEGQRRGQRGTKPCRVSATLESYIPAKLL